MIHIKVVHYFIQNNLMNFIASSFLCTKQRPMGIPKASFLYLSIADNIRLHNYTERISFQILYF